MNTVEKSKKLTDLEVNTISLVSSNETPAVPKATTKFSIFKMFSKKKKGFSDVQKSKLESIKKEYKSDAIIEANKDKGTQ